jgi:hypothetical protein
MMSTAIIVSVSIQASVCVCCVACGERIVTSFRHRFQCRFDRAYSIHNTCLM